STTTQITVDTANTTALTVTQRGTAAAVSATSTSAMTSDIFKITNLGSGKSFVVEDSDTDSSPFVVDASGNVGIASSTPSAALGVQGNVIIANGVLTITTTTATSTLGGPLQISQIKITGPNTPVAAYVLTATDTLGNASWQVIPTGTWISLNGNLYPTTISDNVAISTTTARYDLDVWGDASFGTTTDYNTPLLLVNSSTKRVGIASSTPSSALGVQGNVMIANGVLSITTTTATSSLGMIDITAFRMATGNPGVNKVLTTVEGSGYGVWTSIAGAGGITGSGTAGKLSKFTDTSVIADSVITEADGKIGISTTTPRYGLDVWGDFSVGTSTAGYASGASSTPALFVDSGNGGRVGIGTTTLTNSLFAVGTSTTRFVVALNGNVGVATSTPSDTLAVGGNIIGSGNLVIYGTGTSTFGGGLSIAGLETTGAIWSDNALTLTSSGGAIILTPLSNSNADIVLGGTGLFRVGSTGQFYIDASGNVTTTGSIYAAEGFRTTATNATVRKVGDEILRGVVPVFGFDLPVRC
ncbi:MAG: hypothetical protein Q7J73_09050, partial [Dehalococcoidales bacterium]|nr:hypothetical protein [Dehalococcoidales bacterium]